MDDRGIFCFHCRCPEKFEPKRMWPHRKNFVVACPATGWPPRKLELAAPP